MKAKKYVAISILIFQALLASSILAQDVDFTAGADTVDPLTQPFSDWIIIILAVVMIVVFIFFIGYAILKKDM